MEDKKKTITIPYVISNEGECKTLCPFGLVLPKKVVKFVKKQFPKVDFDGKILVSSIFCQECKYFCGMNEQVVFCNHD